MAEECSATSSSNWWTDAHASAWSTTTTTTTSVNHHNNNFWNPPNPNMNSSNSTCEDPDDVSILSNNSFNNAAASNHSGLSIDSSSRRFVDNNSELIGETPSDHHLWNQVLLNVGSNGVVQNGQNVGDIQLLNTFSAKNLATGLMFDPACDYLKKMDSGWDFSNPPPFNAYDKSFSGNYKEAIYENERLSKLSNMVSNWSIAPPQTEIPCQQFGQQSSNLDHHNQYQQQPTVNETRMSGLQSCNYGHALDEKTMADQPLLGRPVMDCANGYQMGNTNNLPMNEVGDNSKYFYGLNPDLSFGTSLTKPVMDRSATKIINIKNNFYSPHSGKQSTPVAYPKFQTFSAPSSTAARSLRKEHLSAGEGRKKRSDNYEDNFDANSKKPKHDNTYSGIIPAALKLFQPHAPKAKFADKITALQQIVSPFGKTDTASVLWEAIGYIKCLQDQIEERWTGSDHMKGDGDLKSRGLCLMPTESTPPVYRDNSGPDFWAPSYRGFLYR